MVARAVTLRLRQRHKATEKSVRMFYSFSTPSRVVQPPITTSLAPGVTTATSVVSTFISSSTLVRNPAPPAQTFFLRPVHQTKARRAFVEKLVSPPSSRTRSKSKNKKSAKEPTTTTPIPLAHHYAQAKAYAESNFSKGQPLCKFHTCSKQHHCPKAPPWPAHCASCGKTCLFRVQVCDGCGTTLCFDHQYFGICPYIQI